MPLLHSPDIDLDFYNIGGGESSIFLIPKQNLPRKYVYLGNNPSLDFIEFSIDKISFPEKQLLGLLDEVVDKWDQYAPYGGLRNVRPIVDNTEAFGFEEFVPYYVRVGTARATESFLLDEVLIEPFSITPPLVYAPLRYLSELIPPMDLVNPLVWPTDSLLNIMAHNMESPYIHVGTKINRVIYPRTSISVHGKARRK